MSQNPPPLTEIINRIQKEIGRDIMKLDDMTDSLHLINQGFIEVIQQYESKIRQKDQEILELKAKLPPVEISKNT